mmetsp:Transcript_31077/g.93333  ORF Transcript_31077/g.93333 Transcript_31077/m.93333 type:complete len:360 (+) Transcript_31077:134-1213(+)
MSVDNPRPSWTSGLTLDHPLAIFCPHHDEHVKKKEAAAAASAATATGTAAATDGGDGSAAVAASPPAALPATVGCPVMHHDIQSAPATPSDPSTMEPAATLAPGCPIMIGADTAGDSAADSAINPNNNMLLQEKQAPAPGQDTPLPTERRMSTIPKTSENTPGHQRAGEGYWEYPSQQMFYNAMRRKGHEPKEEEMSTIVGMHNAVNERSWAELLEWERQLHPETADGVRLKSFSGDATNISPKARLRSFFGASLPFDRHDWVIVRGDGEEARYIIDFYQAEAKGASPIAFHLDVRPAMDCAQSTIDRVRMSVRKLTGEAQRAAAATRRAQEAPAPSSLMPEFLQRPSSRRWADWQKSA